MHKNLHNLNQTLQICNLKTIDNLKVIYYIINVNKINGGLKDESSNGII
jgi:hypothetical protein